MADRTTDAIALKPCPFCGGSAAYERKGSARASMVIACEDCGVRVESGDVYGLTPAERYRWNRRTPEPAAEPTECRYCGNQKAPDGTTAHRASCAGLESVSVTRLRLDWLREHPESVAYEFKQPLTKVEKDRG